MRMAEHRASPSTTFWAVFTVRLSYQLHSYHMTSWIEGAGLTRNVT